MSGWIKLHRKMLDWEWYQDPNTFRLFVHCLLKANHSDKIWRGLTIPRGSFWTSLESLSDETGLTVKQIRNIIKRLISAGNLASKGQATGSVRGRMITVVGYNEYQSEGKQNNFEGASEGQAKGKQRATTKNDKNNNNEENSIIVEGSSTRPPPKSKWTEQDFRFADWAMKMLNETNPTVKTGETEKWADIVRLMRERDGRTIKEMARVWAWARNDDFWNPNILSMSKFREKFDTLNAQSTRKLTNGSPSYGQQKQSLCERTTAAAEEIFSNLERYSDGDSLVGQDDAPLWLQVGKQGG